MKRWLPIVLSSSWMACLLAACASGGSGSEPTGGVGGAGGSAACPGDLVACDGHCVDTAFDPQHCGECSHACSESQVCSVGKCGIDCFGGTTKCDDQCVDLDTDPGHCGACGSACPSGELCSAGQCAFECTGGTTDCGGTLCVDTKLDPEHCGSCDAACQPGEVCSEGKCAPSCPDPLLLCGSQCTNTAFDPQHCGECSVACPSAPNAVAACAEGACGYLCKAGFGDCNGTPNDGCEIDLAASALHCSGCGKACPPVANGTPACANGVCGIGQCDAGYGDCDKSANSGCEVDLLKDAQNCGSCGNVCPPGAPFCDVGQCAQPPTHGWQILDQKDIVYQGIGYLLLKVKYKSQSAASDNWCQDYLNLCQGFGHKPTGCGDQFMSGGYGWCKQKYQSDGVSNSLGCNASGGVSSAAQQNGYGDANGKNSFAFHYCSDNSNSSCGKQMCQGTYCNNALSYCDYDQPFCYTLCKK